MQLTKPYDDVFAARRGIPDNRGKDMVALAIAAEIVQNGIDVLEPVVMGRAYAGSQARIMFAMAKLMVTRDEAWVNTTDFMHSFQQEEAIDRDLRPVLALDSLYAYGDIGTIDKDGVEVTSFTMATLSEIGDVIGGHSYESRPTPQLRNTNVIQRLWGPQ